MIRIEHLSKSFSTGTPLRDVNAVINNGDIVSVIGPSGCGKTTFLRCINMLTVPTSGKIFIDDDEITAKNCDIQNIRRKMGMVFQNFNLFSNMNVIENVMAAQIKVLKKSRQEAYDKGMELLRIVGMGDKALSFPDEISGGQKQRVSIARTLAVEPEIILFDEPTSALDPTMVSEVLSVIRNLSRLNLTMIIVTHEMNFAKEISNRIFYMDNGEIYEEGTPQQIFDNPRKELTRRFIYRLKLFTADIETPYYDFADIISKIEEFGRKNIISQRKIINIQRVFEELCVLNILNNKSHPVKMQLSVEYSEQSDSADIYIKFNGPACDPFTCIDPISFSIIKNVSDVIEYSPIDEKLFANMVHITVK